MVEVNGIVPSLCWKAPPLQAISIFTTDNRENFQRRYEAASGEIADGTIRLTQVWEMAGQGRAVFVGRRRGVEQQRGPADAGDGQEGQREQTA